MKNGMRRGIGKAVCGDMQTAFLFVQEKIVSATNCYSGVYLRPMFCASGADVLRIGLFILSWHLVRIRGSAAHHNNVQSWGSFFKRISFRCHHVDDLRVVVVDDRAHSIGSCAH